MLGILVEGENKEEGTYFGTQGGGVAQREPFPYASSLVCAAASRQTRCSAVEPARPFSRPWLCLADNGAS
jgi:hypothetical protein